MLFHAGRRYKRGQPSEKYYFVTKIGIAITKHSISAYQSRKWNKMAPIRSYLSTWLTSWSVSVGHVDRCCKRCFYHEELGGQPYLLSFPKGWSGSAHRVPKEIRKEASRRLSWALITAATWILLSYFTLLGTFLSKEKTIGPPCGSLLLLLHQRSTPNMCVMNEQHLRLSYD